MELDRLEKRIRALQARKAARAATFERVQGIDPTEHEAAVYHAIHADIAADAHTYYNLPGGRGSFKHTLGGAFCIDGKLFRGQNQKAGEFGHMILIPGGTDVIVESRGVQMLIVRQVC